MEQIADESEHRSAFEHNNAGRVATHMNWNSNLLGQTSGRINEDWCLVDSQLTCNVFTNQKYLKNIRIAPNGRQGRGCVIYSFFQQSINHDTDEAKMKARDQLLRDVMTETAEENRGICTLD